MTPVGFWTEDRVERLRSLWDDDSLSARMIADSLGTTRNAILGKAHRLNLADKRYTGGSVIAKRIEVRRFAERSRPRPAPKSIVVSTHYFEGPAILRPAQTTFVAPVVRKGTSKTHPNYRNQLGFLPDMTVRERRNMLAEAMANTAALPVEG
jgi:hypothetical protein